MDRKPQLVRVAEHCRLAQHRGDLQAICVRGVRGWRSDMLQRRQRRLLLLLLGGLCAGMLTLAACTGWVCVCGGVAVKGATEIKVVVVVLINTVPQLSLISASTTPAGGRVAWLFHHSKRAGTLGWGTTTHHDDALRFSQLPAHRCVDARFPPPSLHKINLESHDWDVGMLSMCSRCVSSV